MSDVKNNIFLYIYVDCTKPLMSTVYKQTSKQTYSKLFRNFDHEEMKNVVIFKKLSPYIYFHNLYFPTAAV